MQTQVDLGYGPMVLPPPVVALVVAVLLK